MLSHRAFSRFEALSLMESDPYTCTKPAADLPPEEEPEQDDESKGQVQ